MLPTLLLSGWVYAAGLGMAADAGEPGAAQPLFRYRLAGLDQVATDPKLAGLRKAAQLPQTQALISQTLDRLAATPHAFWPKQVSEEQGLKARPVLRRLLLDFFKHESVGEVYAKGDGDCGWWLCVRLSEAGISAWLKDLNELAEGLALGDVERSAYRGTMLHEVKAGETTTVFRWLRIGRWMVLAGSPDSKSWDRFEEVVSGLARGTVEGLPVGEAWLALMADLGRLADRLGWSTAFTWPTVELTVAARGERQRLAGKLDFPKPVTGPMEPWQVPTNTVREPLISFGAMRGVGPLLSASSLWKDLGLTAPNEMYTWAQSAVVAQSYLAFPSDDPTNRVRRMADLLPDVLRNHWQSTPPGEVEWISTNARTVWKSLPLVVPMIWPVQDGLRPFIVAGLFPPMPTKQPPPQELLSQFLNEPDMVYYHWEITEARLGHLRHIAQLYAALLRAPQLRTNTAALPWLMAIETQLGNTVTEVRATTPSQWTFLRQSDLGLTGLELVYLARWLENIEFPRLGLEIAPDEAFLELKRGLERLDQR